MSAEGEEAAEGCQMHFQFQMGLQTELQKHLQEEYSRVYFVQHRHLQKQRGQRGPFQLNLLLQVVRTEKDPRLRVAAEVEVEPTIPVRKVREESVEVRLQRD